jgi:hypothetical protein
VYPSLLREQSVDDVGSDGSGIWVTHAASTRTFLDDGTDVYTASCVDHASTVETLLASCYLLVPERDQSDLRTMLRRLFPDRGFPHLESDGSSHDQYHEWSLDAATVTRILRDPEHADIVEPVRIIAPGMADRDLAACTFIGVESAFRLLVVESTCVAQVIQGRPHLPDIPLVELDVSTAEQIALRPRR